MSSEPFEIPDGGFWAEDDDEEEVDLTEKVFYSWMIDGVAYLLPDDIEMTISDPDEEGVSTVYFNEPVKECMVIEGEFVDEIKLKRSKEDILNHLSDRIPHAGSEDWEEEEEDESF